MGEISKRGLFYLVILVIIVSSVSTYILFKEVNGVKQKMAAMQSGELPSAGGAESAGPADSAAVGILKAEVINPNEQLE